MSYTPETPKIGDTQMNASRAPLAWLRPLLIGLLLCSATYGFSQEVTALDRLQIDLWPEYDRPSMLVIIRGVIASDTPVPATVEFPMPSRSGEPLAVAYQGENGGLFSAPFRVLGSGETLTVSSLMQTRTFQLEYYDPALDLTTSDRKFLFSMDLPYRVAELVVRVQQPRNATNVAGTPPLVEVEQAADGFTYHRAMQANLDAGTPVELSLTYQKGEAGLSVQAPPKTETPPVLPSEGRGQSTTIILVLGLGVVVLSLSTLAAFYFATRARRRQKGAATARPEGGGFCPQCGRPVETEDRFCRNCGTALRE
jgi:hypothetical protein